MPMGLVLYADWDMPELTVTFMVNGEADKSETVAYNGKVQSYVPKAEGYSFNGWFVSAEEGSQLFDFNQPITTNTVIYAHMSEKATAEYTVKFLTDLGNGQFADVAAAETHTGVINVRYTAKAKPATGDYAAYWSMKLRNLLCCSAAQ